MKKNNLTITLIIPHYQNMFSTFYTLEIVKEVSKAALNFGVDLLIETGWKLFPPSGILFADIMNNERWLKKAKEEKIPYLILNYYEQKSKDNCIGIDNAKASFEAVNYLIKAGHRRIATITGKLNAQAGWGRLEGFKKVIKVNKLSLDKRYIVKGDWTKEAGSQAIQKLLRLPNPPSAVFVAGDEMAIGAMEAVKDAGLKVPENISIVGFDNIPQSEEPQICLTTVEQPFSDLANLGVKYLTQIIKKRLKPPVKILLENTKLIKRKSVKVLSNSLR